MCASTIFYPGLPKREHTPISSPPQTPEFKRLGQIYGHAFTHNYQRLLLFAYTAGSQEDCHCRRV